MQRAFPRPGNCGIQALDDGLSAAGAGRRTGEDQQDIKPTMHYLFQNGIGGILDYAAEDDVESEGGAASRELENEVPRMPPPRFPALLPDCRVSAVTSRISAAISPVSLPGLPKSHAPMLPTCCVAGRVAGSRVDAILVRLTSQDKQVCVGPAGRVYCAGV